MIRANTHTRRTKTGRGFTIIEVMVVLVILGLIGGIVTLSLVGATTQAKVDTTKQSMQQIQSAFKMHYTRNNNYPASADWQQAIQNTLSKAPEDAWGNQFLYYQLDDGKNFQLWSAGPDEIQETDDDIMIGPDGEAVGGGG